MVADILSESCSPSRVQIAPETSQARLPGSRDDDIVVPAGPRPGSPKPMLLGGASRRDLFTVPPVIWNTDPVKSL